MGQQYFTKVVLFFACIIIGSGTLNAQGKDGHTQKMLEEELAIFRIKKIIEDKQYIFKAQSYSTSSISMRQVTPNEYDIRVKGDSVIVSLPYFGQSYSAQMSRVDDAGIQFKSVKFDYTAVEKKKGKWLVTIKPKDTKEVQQLFFTIFSDGVTLLQVTLTNREPISFNGYVTTL